MLRKIVWNTSRFRSRSMHKTCMLQEHALFRSLDSSAVKDDGFLCPIASEIFSKHVRLFCTGRGHDRYTSVVWTSSKLDFGSIRRRGCWFHRNSQPIWLFLRCCGSPATAVDSGSSPAGWFPCQMLLRGLFGAAPICPSIVRHRCPLSSFGSSIDCCAS